MDICNIEIRCNYKKKAPDCISNCEEAAEFIINEIASGMTERFMIICMDYDYCPINYSILAIGNSDKVCVDLGELFRVALLSGAKRIVVAHNHLGTSLVPTESDIQTTKQIGYIAKILNIELIDSLVVTADGTWKSIRKYIAGIE